jgi:hypothetical protein
MPGVYDNAYRGIAAKTAAYQIKDGDFAKLLTTRGAAATVTFTLPPTTGLNPGWWIDIYEAADWEMVIASSGSADNITTKNDLTADSLTFTEAGELIGNMVRCIWDGTGWLTQIFAEETVTVAVA